MPTKIPRHPGGSDRDRDHASGQDRGPEFEHDDGYISHIEIEGRRFRGGLPPTAELYALAREQWNQLPGSIVRSPMDPVVAGNLPTDSEARLSESHGDEEQEESL